MSKSISSSLLSDIQNGVMTLATLVTITREDGKSYYITNHDTDINYNGTIYDHSIPFVLSATQTGTDMAVDNNELRLSLDGTVFDPIDFAQGAFYNAEITISLVNFLDPSHGLLTLRKGWFGPISRQQNNVVKITVVGLLRILDLSVGRVYQPSCDADLGDRRCKVAIDQSQAYSPLNRYYVGDWVYRYDDTLMTAITLTNPSFESETTSVGDAITGWTQSPGAQFRVDDGGSGPNPTDGANALWGQYSGLGDANRLEQFVYQDVDLVAGGISATDIDAGKISLAYFVDMAQVLVLTEPLRLKIDILDVDGLILQTMDTLAFNFKETDLFQMRALAGPIVAGARTARIFIYMYRENSSLIRNGADNVRMFWWDHTTGNPYSNRIHRCSKVTAFSSSTAIVAPNNPSFELPVSPVAPSTTQDIPSWTKGAGSYYGSATAAYGFNANHGSRFLYAGDDSSGVQKTYSISQTKALVNLGLSAEVIALGSYIGKFNVDVLHGAVDSTARVTLEFLNVSNTVVSTVVVRDYEVAGSAGWATNTKTFNVPSTATSVRITLSARSPIGDSVAKIGFDRTEFLFADVSRPLTTDVASGFGDDVPFDTTTGAYTADGDLVWRAKTFHVEYDTVATVTDRKVFTATTIAGATGAYTTSVLMWLSGANKGQRNLVRLWTPGTKAVKLYFPSLDSIQVGDRFMIIRSCQKRFEEDCVLTFDNGINFRGFPYLPGRV